MFWLQVFDFSNESADGSPNFSIEGSFLGWWEIPVDGNTQYENPVPASTGDMYSAVSGCVLSNQRGSGWVHEAAAAAESSFRQKTVTGYK